MTKSKAYTRKQAAILAIIDDFTLDQLALALACLRDIEAGYPAQYDDPEAVRLAFQSALDAVLRRFGVCPANRPSNG